MKNLNSLSVALFLAAASVMALGACGGDSNSGSGGGGSGGAGSTSTGSSDGGGPASGESSSSSASGPASSSSTSGSSSSSSSTSGSSSSGGMMGGSSLKADVQPILTANCAKAGCHVAGATSPNLSEGQTIKAVGAASKCTGKKIITAGDATKSHLVSKITGKQGNCGSAMPLGGTMLSDDKIKTIENWINAGAKND